MTALENDPCIRSQLRVVDVHTHLHPDYLDKAARLMDKNHIQMLCDISPNLNNELERLTQRMAAFPGRFACFAGVDFEGFGGKEWTEREIAAVKRAVALGAVGIKFSKGLGLTHRDSDGQIIRVDDCRLSPLLDIAADLDVVVAFHTGDPRAFFEPLVPCNERWEELRLHPTWWFGNREKYPYDWWSLIRQLERVVQEHPKTLFLGVHFGNAAEEIEYVADVLRRNPNYIVDVAARIGELGRHNVELVRQVFTEFQDRILFGTDLGIRKSIMLGAPQGFEPVDDDVTAFYNDHWRFFETNDHMIGHPTPIQGNWRVNAIALPEAVLEKVYAKNAERYVLKRA